MTNPFQHARRRQRTALQIARIFADRDGCCHICKRRLGPRDRWELDHIIAISKGGTDEDDNLAPCCSWCHDPKSDDDTSDAASIKQGYAKHYVPKKHQRSSSWGRR